MIAITATWVYRLGDGPLWDRLVGTASSDCRDQWLPGLLYINNYYKTERYVSMIYNIEISYTINNNDIIIVISYLSKF